MKAEHRKELETNTLADKMGQAMQRVKTGNRRTFIITLVVAALVAVALWVVYANVSETRKSASDAWVKFDDGGEKIIVDLGNTQGSTPAGKAALLQYAWMHYWELGVKKIGTDPMGAMIELEKSGKIYAKLAEECKDEDPLLFLPQALLGVAVVDECRAIQDSELFLKKAKDGYQALQDKKFENTGEAAFAKERLDQLKDAEKAKKIADLYEELQKKLGVRGIQQMPGFGPPILKGFDPKELDPLPPPEKKK